MRLERIFSFLGQCPESIYLVGGCLRQRLLGLPVNDYDFIVSHGAIELAQLLAQTFKLPWFILDKERDMARVVINQIEFDFARIAGPDLLHDLSQRDISINAMAYPVDVGILSEQWQINSDLLIDPMGGYPDLKRGLIKGISQSNFESDPLRLLRVFRFSARLEFEIEPQTLAWIHSLSRRIQEPAKERVMHELFLLLSSEASTKTCLQMLPSGLLGIILDSTFEHLNFACQTLERFENRSITRREKLNPYLERTTAGERHMLFLIKLACLTLPVCATGQKCPESSLILEKTRLDLSRLEIDTLVLWNKNIKKLLSGCPLDSLLDKFRFLQETGVHIISLWLIYLALPSTDPNVSKNLESLVSEWLNPESLLAHPPALVSGHDILDHLKLKPGPQIGLYIQSIKEAQVQGVVVDRNSALNYLADLAANDTQ